MTEKVGGQPQIEFPVCESPRFIQQRYGTELRPRAPTDTIIDSILIDLGILSQLIVHGARERA